MYGKAVDEIKQIFRKHLFTNENIEILDWNCEGLEKEVEDFLKAFEKGVIESGNYHKENERGD